MKCNRGGQRGATLVEFTLAAILVVLPLCMLILQLSLLTVTRRALDVAVVLTARAGAADHGRAAAMRTTLGEALTPLFVTAPAGDATAAARDARASVNRADRIELTLLAPTALAQAGLAVAGPFGLEIPNEGFDRRLGASIGAARVLLDANTLKLNLRYCAPMVVPIAAAIISAIMRSSLWGEPPGAFDQRCIAEGRIPLRVVNAQVMQSSFYVANAGSLVP